MNLFQSPDIVIGEIPAELIVIISPEIYTERKHLLSFVRYEPKLSNGWLSEVEANNYYSKKQKYDIVIDVQVLRFDSDFIIR